MKTFTISDIRSWKPCYDPARHLPEDWQGTALDILRHNEIPPHDKFWVVCREELIDAKTLRLFAVWCARQVKHLMTDPRSIAVLDVAEKFAHGTATKEELATARAAALAARVTGGVAWDTDGDAAWDGAVAAWAARDAAVAAAGEARARDTAALAARAAGGARDTARAAQVSKLIEMLEDSDT